MSTAMTTAASTMALRRTGIGVVGDVPWGTHFFMFHETKEDLLDILTPFFKAGLENSELCVWIISEPLNEERHTPRWPRAYPVLTGIGTTVTSRFSGGASGI